MNRALYCGLTLLSVSTFDLFIVRVNADVRWNFRSSGVGKKYRTEGGGAGVGLLIWQGGQPARDSSESSARRPP